MTFEEATTFALALSGTEHGTSYGKPAVKVASNGRAFLFPSHEADTSFAVAMDRDTIEILQGDRTRHLLANAALRRLGRCARPVQR